MAVYPINRAKYNKKRQIRTFKKQTTSKFSKSFFLSKTSNKLPIQFKELTSTNSLKSKLKRNMFLEYREFRCNKHNCYSCTHT